MCHGIVTQLSCGHVLEHISHCPQFNPSDGLPCNVVTWDRHRLYDTCAACDAGRRTRQLANEYEARHAALIVKLLEARRAGDEARVEALTGEVMRLVGWQRAKMSEILAAERGMVRDESDVSEKVSDGP
ncbi:uncharacterized protein DNG_08563 [Cephalotrichum gorgonifer]|uniref:Uncharacterized protein n=1 Tax=Cephalotrichum gorgonifer TaxID=2041049 RepID=A0AAE8N5B9_9PEZI|nr:uncharacterized protein DNG_08563 [Cephalotrichum gorgonifer]